MIVGKSFTLRWAATSELASADTKPNLNWSL